MTTDLVQSISILTNFFIIGFVMIYFVYLQRKENNLRSREEKIDGKYHHILEEAAEKERKIIADATEQANQLLTETNLVNKNIKEDLEQALKQIVQNSVNTATQSSDTSIKAYQEAVKNAQKQIMEQLDGIFLQFRNDTQMQLKDYQTNMLNNTKKELEDYKKSQIASIDHKVGGLVQTIARDILGKTIPLDEHEKLVVEALNKAKKEGTFDL